MSKLFVIRYAPARLIVATIPKSGSTTIIAAFLALAGFGKENPRRFIREPDSTRLLAEKGVFITTMETSKLKDLQSELHDYYFVTVMRDPSQRLLSGYLNKINRYAKRFALPIYIWGKLRQFFSGPKSWNNINRCNLYIRKLISFEKFITGLERHGTAWDEHFTLQTSLADTGSIDYQEIIHLETLDMALINLLARRGVEPEALEKLHHLPRFNVTQDNNRQALLTQPALMRITNLYQADYEFIQRLRENSQKAAQIK